MSLYSKIFTTILLPISEFIFSIPLSKEIEKLDKTTKLSEIEIEKYQKEKLSELLSHAIKNAEYYTNLGIAVDPNMPMDSLKRFPILTKKIIKTQTDSLLTLPKEELLKNGSSGSTGEQTIVYWSKKEQTFNRATQLLWWQWAKYNLGDKLIQTGINPKRQGLKKYKDFFFRTKYIQAFSHNKEDILHILSKLNKNQEYTLAGYASSLYVISQIAIENKIELKIKTAIAWGDKLFDHYKKAVFEAFNCRVYETYGSAEGLMIGAQKDLDYLYLMTTNVVVELLDDAGNEVEDGKIGHVVVTNLNGYAMPLIRYKIGDLAIKLPRKDYPKNRELNLPILQKIIGRDTDIVKTPSGNFMVVHSFTGIFEHIPEINQFCVVQNDLNGIVINYIKGINFKPEILTSISKQIESQLNEPFIINFNEVLEIKPSKSGKPQLIISNLKNRNH
ncbi:phenylacetate--CoA ligase family protein [Flavobacterium cellulosilyticum]|uniref:Phenylacetate--CoA ligase family protein n=1 Tax=Flavobacterium cellulosilyticum TaxID=2541731 RepID=A0A4R5CHF4_9FLAO|nr:phenylacetate--CoA ligase family protein [Flavobacterium cellulosilyticum]TDD99628.1 phenylacetate--CoA ligase family protein [Flavobacterium cellulosilyticum]